MATTTGWRSTVTSSTPIGTNECNLPAKHIKHAKGFGDFGSGISFASIRVIRSPLSFRRS
jgi:hypothetical protein